MTTGSPQRHGAVAVGLTLRDGPRLADEATAEAPVVDLLAQRRRRQPEPDCRLSECEHLAARRGAQFLEPRGGFRLLRGGDALGGDGGLRDADGEVESGVVSAVLLGHLVPLRSRSSAGRHNLDDTAYVVKGYFR